MPNKDDFDAAVRARVELLEKARKVLPDGRLDFNALSEREIQTMVLQKIYGDAVSFNDKSDAYVNARFRHAMELDSGRLDAAKGGAAPAGGAATATEQEYTPDWMRPCTFTRENVSEPMVQRGGVARDENGERLADWMQPLSYTLGPQWGALSRQPPDGS